VGVFVAMAITVIAGCRPGPESVRGSGRATGTAIARGGAIVATVRAD